MQQYSRLLAPSTLPRDWEREQLRREYLAATRLRVRCVAGALVGSFLLGGLLGLALRATQKHPR